jgi:hypothetical protein
MQTLLVFSYSTMKKQAEQRTRHDSWHKVPRGGQRTSMERISFPDIAMGMVGLVFRCWYCRYASIQCNTSMKNIYQPPDTFFLTHCFKLTRKTSSAYLEDLCFQMTITLLYSMLIKHLCEKFDGRLMHSDNSSRFSSSLSFCFFFSAFSG